MIPSWNKLMLAWWRIDRRSSKCSPKTGVNWRIFKRLNSHGLDASLQCI
jgi:hypothetical protein